MRLSLVTPPPVEPLTLAEAKLHLKMDDIATDDPLIDDLIQAAREQFEREYDRQVITASWLGKLDRFPCSDREPICVPRAPLLSVTSIQYVDTAGATQTWNAAEYTVDVFAGPLAPEGLIYPRFGFTWPVPLAIPDAVTVNFTAGYGAEVDHVPEWVRAEIKALLGLRHAKRDQPDPGARPWVYA